MKRTQPKRIHLELGGIAMNEMSVGLFFQIGPDFLYHHSSLEDAEKYGDFLIFPVGHDQIWQEQHQESFFVDYDFYPRGRIVYRKTDDTFIVYHDRCLAQETITQHIPFLKDVNTVLSYDEHYQCSWCNKNYRP